MIFWAILSKKTDNKAIIKFLIPLKQFKIENV